MLAIEPLWPSGQYNAARIYEEVKNYNMAVMHMKRYLLLKPDDKDARALQDKIYVWQEKAKEEEDAASLKTHRCNFLTYPTLLICKDCQNDLSTDNLSLSNVN